MKTHLKRAISAVLLLAVVFSFAACSAQDKHENVMTFRNEGLDERMFSYILSNQIIYYLAYSNVFLPYIYSTTAEYQSLGSFDNFQYYVQYYPALHDQLYSQFASSFATTITGDDGTKKTLGSMYFESVLPYIKKAFVIYALCNELGISVTDKDVLGDMSSELESLVKKAGNKAALDIILYDKYGASYDIAKQYTQKFNITAMITAESGGEDSLYWDPDYPYLNYLLYDYFYGKNGTRRISEETAKSKFLEDYCIIDYVYYSAYKTVNNETVLRLDDFYGNDIKELFNNNYKKVSYVSIARKDSSGGDVTKSAEAKAAEILEKLNSGNLEWAKIGDSYTGTKSGSYVFAPGDSTVDDKVEEAVVDLASGSFTVVTGTDNVFVLRGETLAESDLAAVKKEITTVLSKRYFQENYQKMEYIFLSFHDSKGDDYSEEKINEIRNLGKEIKAKLQSGDVNFDKDSDKFVEKLYKDAAWTVKIQTATYGKNDLQDDLEEVVSKLNIGDIGEHEDEFGYYILKPAEKADSDFNDTAVQLAMTMDKLFEVARDFETKYNNGEVKFEDADKHSTYANYSVLGYVDYNEYSEQIKQYYSIEKLGDIHISPADTSLNVIHVRKTTQEDYGTYKNDVLEEFNYNDFLDYLDEAYKELQIDEDVLNRFKSTFTSFNILDIPSIDSKDTSNTSK